MDFTHISVAPATNIPSQPKQSFAKRAVQSIKRKAYHFSFIRHKDGNGTDRTLADRPQISSYRQNKLPRILRFIVIAAIAALILIGAFKFITGGGSDNVLSGETQVAEGAALASQVINKEIAIPVKDAKGSEISKLRLSVEKAELIDEIIVKGQKATAIKGRTFLIVTLKITNEYTQALEMKTRDYIRLSVNNSDEWLAPDIHNDPVEVQAIATKYTRLGFPINKTDTDLKLRIGEISGKKEDIELNF